MDCQWFAVPSCLGRGSQSVIRQSPIYVRADSSHAVVKAQAYGLRDTPSLVLIDMLGRLRLSHFGRMED